MAALVGGKKMEGGRQEEEEGEAHRKKKKPQEEEERKNKTAIGTTVTPSPSPASTVAVNRAAPLNQDEEEGIRLSAKQLADKMRYFTYPAVL
jgi:Mrp family chromosome partitioning ATPase